jgi:hypothetical protein
MGDLNAKTENQKLEKIVGTNGEPTINSSGSKLTDFCSFDKFRIMNRFSSTKISTNLRGRPETQNQ